MPPNANEFDLSGTSAEFISLDPFFPTRPYFAVPKIAHVCREMRQCAMQKYKFIGFRHPVTTINAEPVQDIAESAIWTDLPGESRIGFFDSAKDSIQIHLTSLHAVHLIQNAAVQCSDPFRAPTSTGNISTRKKKYSENAGKKLFIFIRKDCGIWQSYWQPAWIGNRERPTLVKSGQEIQRRRRALQAEAHTNWADITTRTTLHR